MLWEQNTSSNKKRMPKIRDNFKVTTETIPDTLMNEEIPQLFEKNQILLLLRKGPRESK